jgi:redox-sensitive bicupin YhaK (pirin superfamily)
MNHCRQNSGMTQALIIRRPAGSLMSSDMGWLSLRDHFIATVGPYAGKGSSDRHLLVLADATIAPGSRFPLHPHRDMEILTWVVSGDLDHHDDQGHSAVIPSGHLQLMSARDGLVHAEGNRHAAAVRLLQIWLRPDTRGGAPFYATAALEGSGFQLLAAREGAPLPLLQDVRLYAARLHGGAHELSVPVGHTVYAVSIGELAWNGQKCGDGDGLFIGSGDITVKGSGQAIVLIQAQ